MRSHSAGEQHNRRLTAAIGSCKDVDDALMRVVNFVVAGRFVAHERNESSITMSDAGEPPETIPTFWRVIQLRSPSHRCASVSSLLPMELFPPPADSRRFRRLSNSGQRKWRVMPRPNERHRRHVSWGKNCRPQALATVHYSVEKNFR